MEENVIPLESKRFKVFCFGNTLNGELGLGGIDEDHILAPRKQKSAQLNRKHYSIKQIACGRNHTVMLLTTPTIMKGTFDADETELCSSSIVISCGSNEMMQLGRTGSWKKFESVDNLSLHLVDQLACGANHTLALTAAGQVFSWGCNLFGQLGLCIHARDQDSISKPSLIKKLALETVVQISCGGNHSLALTNTGLLWAWGSNAFGQLGTGQKGNCVILPVCIASLRHVPLFCIAAGGSHSLALSYTGALYSWGKNEFGQLGLGDTDSRSSPVLQTSLRNQQIWSVSCGEEHSAALTEEGGLFTWGAGMYGQLGHGKPVNELLPRRVFELMGTTISQVACGRCHTLAVDGGRGRLWSFGLNGTGQLGIGTQVSKLAPIKVDGPWAEISAKELSIRQLSGALVVKQNEGVNIVKRVIEITDGNESKFESNQSPRSPFKETVASSNDSEIMEVEDTGDIDVQETEASDMPGAENPSPSRRRSVILVQEPDEPNEGGTGQHKQDTDVEIIEYQSDPDSDNYDKCCRRFGSETSRPVSERPQFNPHRRQLKLLTAIAGRGDHSFALTAYLGDDIVVKDLRAIKNKGSLAVLENEDLERLLITNNLDGKEEQDHLPIDAIEYIETTFGSVATWNASYIRKWDLGNALLPRIDWDEAKKGFQLLNKVHNNRFIEILSNVIVKVISELPSELSSLDTEILRVFLLLPYLPCFNCTTNRDESLIEMATKYATAVGRLDKDSQNILKSWVGDLETSCFQQLIDIYMSCVLSVITNEHYEKEVSRQWEMFHRASYVHPNYLLDHKKQETLKCSLDFLRFLYDVNENAQVVSYKNFYIKELTEKNIIFMDYGYYKSRTSNSHASRITLFCEYAFTLEPGAKMLALELDSIMKQMSRQEVYMVPTVHNQIQVYAEPAYLDLRVSRNNLIRSTIEQLCRTDSYRREDFKKMLRVHFIGEEAIDAGSGVKKEFFLLLMKEALDVQFGMFAEYVDTRTIWFNASMNDMYSDDDFVMYDMIGVICGLAIYNRVLLFLPFPLPLYKKLLDEPLMLDDLAVLDPTLVRNLKTIIDTPYSREEFNAIYAEMNFVITINKFDTVVEEELCPGGKNLYLDYENRKEYVELYWDYVLIKSVERQYQCFKNGFLKVVDREVLKLFNAEELLQLVIGKQDYDWELLEKVALYKEPFSPSHPTIAKFWRVFHSLTTEEKKKFLLFLTGSDRIPIIGMKHVELKFQSMKVSEEHFPVAHTCFNLLDLPEEYSSEDVLKAKLLQAIEHTQGFSLA